MAWPSVRTSVETLFDCQKNFLGGASPQNVMQNTGICAYISGGSAKQKNTSLQKPFFQKSFSARALAEQDFSLKMTVNYHREMVLNAICSKKPNEARDAAHAHLSFIKKILTNVA